MRRALIRGEKPSIVPAAKNLLDGFLEHGAISQAQHGKSLHDLIEKMGEHE